jgi:uncharacterized membrane protein YkgB
MASMAEAACETAEMDEPQQLQHLGPWRTAVWALRVGFIGLAVVLVGAIVLATGNTPWVLGVGVLIWIGAAIVTVSGVVRARHELPEPRPGLLPLRFMLLRDTFRARAAG